jgi:hypothetical protein
MEVGPPVRVVRRKGFARPYPEGQPTRPGARCELSDLLESECACKKHRKEEPRVGPTEAEEEELDFR